MYHKSMKNKLITLIVFVVVFSIGFYAGSEYKAFQIRSAFNEASKQINDAVISVIPPQSSDEKTAVDYARENSSNVKQKTLSDDIALATIKLKVNKIDEKQTISSPYGSPKVAKEGAKFVIINVDVTNTTDSPFSFSTDFPLLDNKGRSYTSYRDTIGSIDNHIDVRQLSPNIKENGNIVYEIPNDATGYSLVIGKAGTKEVYKIILK